MKRTHWFGEYPWIMKSSTKNVCGTNCNGRYIEITVVRAKSCYSVPKEVYVFHWNMFHQRDGLGLSSKLKCFLCLTAYSLAFAVVFRYSNQGMWHTGLQTLSLEADALWCQHLLFWELSHSTLHSQDFNTDVWLKSSVITLDECWTTSFKSLQNFTKLQFPSWSLDQCKYVEEIPIRVALWHYKYLSLQKAQEPNEVKGSPDVAVSFQLFSTGWERNWAFEKSFDLQTKWLVWLLRAKGNYSARINSTWITRRHESAGSLAVRIRSGAAG